MKNIYFVEAGFSFDNDVYLPYSTGTIAAFMKKKGCFDKKFNLAGFIFRKEKTDNIIEKLDAPYIVGFSCCIWNQNFNLALAKKIKENYPECIIIFGGHNISDKSNMLKEYPFIDILVFGEGEIPFSEIVLNSENRDFLKIDNIAFRKNENIFVTPRTPAPDISDFPSPYLSGIFDTILETENHSSLLCILETNRGCPYNCSYCDWCSGKKVRLFPLERVLNELKWMSDQKIEYCFCADSNFGIFDRDITIAATAAQLKQLHGYPKVLKTCFAKESNENVFKISKILNDSLMDKGATLAYQTLSPVALQNINRKNLTLEHFSDLLKKYNESGIPTYSELILGLPGETKESFCEGICKILESGQHNSLSIYYLEMLPNSQMAQSYYRAKHSLNTIDVGFNHMHSIRKPDEIEEVSHIVHSTATMTVQDWIYCNLFAICVQCFHSLGLLRYISMYLNNEMKISYYSFYSELLDYILSDKNSVTNSVFESFNEKLSSSFSGDWNYVSDDFGEVSWAFEEGAFLTFLKNSDEVYQELEPFLKKYFTDTRIFNQLKEYQKSVLRKVSETSSEIVCDYDFLSFFEAINQGQHAVLKQQKTKYTFISNETYYTWKDFAKNIVWFGRRKGATYYSNRPNSQTKILKDTL